MKLIKRIAMVIITGAMLICSVACTPSKEKEAINQAMNYTYHDDYDITVKTIKMKNGYIVELHYYDNGYTIERYFYENKDGKWEMHRIVQEHYGAW